MFKKMSLQGTLGTFGIWLDSYRCIMIRIFSTNGTFPERVMYIYIFTFEDVHWMSKDSFVEWHFLHTDYCSISVL